MGLYNARARTGAGFIYANPCGILFRFMTYMQLVGPSLVSLLPLYTTLVSHLGPVTDKSRQTLAREKITNVLIAFCGAVKNRAISQIDDIYRSRLY